MSAKRYGISADGDLVESWGQDADAVVMAADYDALQARFNTLQAALVRIHGMTQHNATTAMKAIAADALARATEAVTEQQGKP